MKIVILAGGSGMRLWPLSRGSFPKQFFKLGDDFSLLQKSVQRFWPLYNLEDILIVTSPACHHLVKSQLMVLNPAFEHRILVEPAARNTAPAIAIALKYLQEKENISSSESILISPSDHFMEPISVFLDALLKADKAAHDGFIVTFGIRPDKPETGFGYLELGLRKEEGLYEIARFIEKPLREAAEGYLDAGHFLWNSGMFVFTPQVFWEELQKHAPRVAVQAHQSLEQMKKDYEQIPEISIDYAVMEASQCLVAIPLDLTWSDMGSWDSVFEMMEKDENQNVKIGNICDVDTKNSLIYGGKRLISTIGMEDIILIQTEDALFLGKKGDSQRVKKIVEELKIQGKKESQEHRTVYRPWGTYAVIEEGQRFKVKKIVVDPMQRLSLQYHQHRSEHWVVVKGRAKVLIGEQEQILETNQGIYVPPLVVHRLENPTETPIELIEVQVGDYLEEDDIIRLEDAYIRK